MNPLALRTVLLLGCTTLAACAPPPDDDVDTAVGAATLKHRKESCPVTKMASGNFLLDRSQGPRQLVAAEDGQVTVYLHNIKKSAGNSLANDGHVPDSTLDQIVALLNAKMQGVTVFVKGSVDRVVRPEWYEVLPLGEFPATPAETAMKAALKKGNSALALNIYTRGGTSNISSAMFPADYGAAPERDGISVFNEELPRSGVDGDVVVHETGHWLGLFHTFQGGCNGNLGPDDVAHEASNNGSAANCTVGVRDTCGNDNGLPDPIDNFMDYAPLSCRNIRAQFTDGQGLLMAENFGAWRLN